MAFPRRQPRDGLWQCAACKAWLPPERYYVDHGASSGLSSRCRPCHTERNLATRDKARAAEFSREYRQRPEVAERERKRATKRRRSPEWKARYDLNLAVKRGIVGRPAACSQCGESGRIEGHHPDYAKPLDVVWLCSGCHVQLHCNARQTA